MNLLLLNFLVVSLIFLSRLVLEASLEARPNGRISFLIRRMSVHLNPLLRVST